MGVALALVFDKNVPEARAFAQYTDGKDLARAMDRFDAICAAKGVPPLSALAGPDEDELEALADESAAGERVPDRWFGCAAGLRTVRAVVAALRSEREWSKGLRPHEVRGLVECLTRLEDCLAAGKKRKARFHLLYC